MADEQTPEKDFILYVVKQLVETPDAVVVDQREDDLGTLITLEVDPVDMGRIIGKSGQTAKSLRTLLRVVGSKFDKRVNLKILEPGGEDGAPGVDGTDVADAEAPAADDTGSDDMMEV